MNTDETRAAFEKWVGLQSFEPVGKTFYLCFAGGVETATAAAEEKYHPLVDAAKELVNNAAPDGYRNALCNQRGYYDDLRKALAPFSNKGE